MTKVFAQELFDKDYIHTSEGTVEVTFIGHSSLMLLMDDYVIHVDPSRSITDYKDLPKADLILVTHHHHDHCDPIAVNDLQKENTKIVVSVMGRDRLKKGMTANNGQVLRFDGLQIKAIPAYNIVHKSQNRDPYHIKGEGNGYILTIGKTRIYIAGDTENIPEMKELRYIDVAFLPMGMPTTMTPEMVADAVAAFKPKILYPYHYRGTNIQKLLDLLQDNEKTVVHVRRMY